MGEEEWLELPLDDRYLISTHGQLYSTIRRRLLVPQWMRRADTETEILYWRLGRRRQMVRCAHWVLMTFGPERPSDFYVATHIDGDRGNCRLDNLAWCPRLTDAQLTATSHRRFK